MRYVSSRIIRYQLFENDGRMTIETLPYIAVKMSRSIQAEKHKAKAHGNQETTLVYSLELVLTQLFLA